MTSVNKMMSDNRYINMREMLKDCISDVQERAINTGVPGIPTGFQPLDDLTGGFEKGKVYVIGGRPVSLKDFSPFNEPVKKLIKELDLEEELPF